MVSFKGVSIAVSDMGYSVMQFTFSLCFFSRIREFSEQQVYMLILSIITQLPPHVHLEYITQYLVVYLIQYVRFEFFMGINKNRDLSYTYDVKWKRKHNQSTSTMMIHYVYSEVSLYVNI